MNEWPLKRPINSIQLLQTQVYCFLHGVNPSHILSSFFPCRLQLFIAFRYIILPLISDSSPHTQPFWNDFSHLLKDFYYFAGCSWHESLQHSVSKKTYKWQTKGSNRKLMVLFVCIDSRSLSNKLWLEAMYLNRFVTFYLLKYSGSRLASLVHYLLLFSLLETGTEHTEIDCCVHSKVVKLPGS